MAKKGFYALIGLSLLLSTTYPPQPALAQGEELSKIFINCYCINNRGEKPEWFKGSNTIRVTDINECTKITLEVKPGEGSVKNVESSDGFPVKVYVNDSLVVELPAKFPGELPFDDFSGIVHDDSSDAIQKLDIKFPCEIKKYKAQLKKDDVSPNKFVLHVKLNYKIIITKWDGLILPFLYKVGIKLPFRSISPKKHVIEIRRESD